LVKSILFTVLNREYHVRKYWKFESRSIRGEG